MMACLLGKRLLKGAIPFSRWASAHLNDAERDYGCLDTFASVLCTKR